jgi:hypothetical protein
MNLHIMNACIPWEQYVFSCKIMDSLDHFCMKRYITDYAFYVKAVTINFYSEKSNYLFFVNVEIGPRLQYP